MATLFGVLLIVLTYIDKKKILQKRIVRIITKSNFDAHTLTLFSQHNLLRLEDIHSLQLGLFLYSIENKIYPNTFQAMFQKNCQFHSYQTRYSNKFRSDLCRTNIKKNYSNQSRLNFVEFFATTRKISTFLIMF